jgi:hypothetical protein
LIEESPLSKLPFTPSFSNKLRISSLKDKTLNPSSEEELLESDESVEGIEMLED